MVPATGWDLHGLSLEPSLMTETCHCPNCGEPCDWEDRFCGACRAELPSAGERRTPAIRGDPPDEAETDLGLTEGTLLTNRYRILKELGTGGMGRVYQAEDRKLEVLVTIKVMREILSRDVETVRQVIAEARHTMLLSHPNIVRVHNFEDGETVKFLVTEYVDGETLQHRLGERGKLSEEEARRIGIEICKGLGHAHEKKVIHRDIKPGNILLGKDGSIKIADFGIARICRDSMSRLTSQQDFGTLLYMSPEQLDGESSELSDLYSLGVVLYESLSGRPPFHTGEISNQIRHKAPEELSDVTPALNSIVLRCLEKQPEKRFPSVRELREELDGTTERRRKEKREQEERVEALKEKGTRAFDEGEYGAAVVLWVEALALSPKHPGLEEAIERARRQKIDVEGRAAECRRAERKAEERASAAAPLSALARKPGYRRAISWVVAAIAVIMIVVYLANRPREQQVEPQAETAQPEETTNTQPSNPSPGTIWRSPIDGREMAWIPPGGFLMGSPKSEPSRDSDEAQHMVRIELGFWMDVTAVTNEAYRKFVLAKPEWQKGTIGRKYQHPDYLKDWSGDDFPAGMANHAVIYVSWHSARAYAEWAGKRLPTEAEWEYACRAGSKTAYWWGDSFDGGRANNNQQGTVALMDERHRNPWNLYDMSGDVWAWTSSLYMPYPYRSDDGREDPQAAGARALRGGSWYGAPKSLRSAYRYRANPESCLNTVGFRCVQ